MGPLSLFDKLRAYSITADAEAARAAARTSTSPSSRVLAMLPVMAFLSARYLKVSHRCDLTR
jgi:hypothetical protein